MKSILIIAAALMTGASVYGIVDYNKKAGKTEFKQMYKNEEAKPAKELNTPPPVETKSEPAVTAFTKNEKTKPVEKNTPARKSIKKKKRSKISFKSFSRARLG